MIEDWQVDLEVGLEPCLQNLIPPQPVGGGGMATLS